MSSGLPDAHAQLSVVTYTVIITGLPIHSVEGARLVTVTVVVVCNTSRRHNVTCQGAARDCGPVMLCPVRATPCFTCFVCVNRIDAFFGICIVLVIFSVVLLL